MPDRVGAAVLLGGRPYYTILQLGATTTDVLGRTQLRYNGIWDALSIRHHVYRRNAQSAPNHCRRETK